MTIDLQFFDDEVPFERLLALLRRGELPKVDVRVFRQDRRLCYSLRGEMDGKWSVEETLRASRIRKTRGHPVLVYPLDQTIRPMPMLEEDHLL